LACVIGRSPAVAAGATWTSRTTNAPWAARSWHTSVIDAAGAIYVIGGVSITDNHGITTNYQDVWASTNGGAHRSQFRILERALGGYHEVLAGYLGYYVDIGGVLAGSSRRPRGVVAGL
jgi:hypothetical protein